MSTSERIAQAVVDALEDLKIKRPDDALWTVEHLLMQSDDNDDLVNQLRSQVNNLDDCPLEDPSKLEQLHFMTTTLQRQALKDAKSKSSAPHFSQLSPKQQELVKQCEQALQADYERRMLHMKQRFNILQSTFGDEVNEIKMKKDDDDFEINVSSFLVPSTRTTRHVARNDEAQAASDRGGRVTQTESRNAMPDFTDEPRVAGSPTKNFTPRKKQTPTKSSAQNGGSEQTSSANGKSATAAGQKQPTKKQTPKKSPAPKLKEAVKSGEAIEQQNSTKGEPAGGAPGKKRTPKKTPAKKANIKSAATQLNSGESTSQGNKQTRRQKSPAPKQKQGDKSGDGAVQSSSTSDRQEQATTPGKKQGPKKQPPKKTQQPKTNQPDDAGSGGATQAATTSGGPKNTTPRKNQTPKKKTPAKKTNQSIAAKEPSSATGAAATNANTSQTPGKKSNNRRRKPTANTD